MSDQLVTEILNIEAEADNVVGEARQKTAGIVANIHNEIELIKTAFENEYRQKLEMLKAKIAELQKSEEEGLRNEFELLEKKLLHINNERIENAVDWVVKHIYES